MLLWRNEEMQKGKEEKNWTKKNTCLRTLVAEILFMYLVCSVNPNKNYFCIITLIRVQKWNVYIHALIDCSHKLQPKNWSTFDVGLQLLHMLCIFLNCIYLAGCSKWCSSYTFRKDLQKKGTKLCCDLRITISALYPDTICKWE